MTTSNAVASRVRRHGRVRRKVSGTEQRPRLNVFRSTTHIYAQVIDDTTGRTIVAASDLDKDLAANVKGKSKTEQAVVVGTSIADKAKAQGIKLVVFDRGGFKYHGRVKALADAAREAGLGF